MIRECVERYPQKMKFVQLQVEEVKSLPNAKVISYNKEEIENFLGFETFLKHKDDFDVELWVQLDESYKMNFGVELGDYIVKCDDDIYVFKEEDFYEEFWVVSTAGDIPF
jgi:hypothetical protein